MTADKEARLVHNVGESEEQGLPGKKSRHGSALLFETLLFWFKSMAYFYS